MAAYPLARMEFRGRNAIFALLVGSLMVPNAVLLVPQYVLTQRLGWLSTYQGLIVPEAAMTFAFGVFLLRQFFLTIPRELEDAARIDGAGTWRVFTRIVLPLSQPVLAALAIFAVPVGVERFPVAADRREPARDVPAAGGPGAAPRRLRVGVLRADHGRGDAVGAAAPARLRGRQPAYRGGRPRERAQRVREESQ